MLCGEDNLSAKMIGENVWNVWNNIHVTCGGEHGRGVSLLQNLQSVISLMFMKTFRFMQDSCDLRKPLFSPFTYAPYYFIWMHFLAENTAHHMSAENTESETTINFDNSMRTAQSETLWVCASLRGCYKGQLQNGGTLVSVTLIFYIGTQTMSSESGFLWKLWRRLFEADDLSCGR